RWQRHQRKSTLLLWVYRPRRPCRNPFSATHSGAERFGGPRRPVCSPVHRWREAAFRLPGGDVQEGHLMLNESRQLSPGGCLQVAELRTCEPTARSTWIIRPQHRLTQLSSKGWGGLGRRISPTHTRLSTRLGGARTR